VGLRRLTLAVLGCLVLQGAYAQSEPACDEFSQGGVQEALRADPAHERRCFLTAMALIRQSNAYDARLPTAEHIGKTLQRLRPQSAYASSLLVEVAMRRRELGLRDGDSLQVILEGAARATRLAPVPPEAYVTLGRAELLAGCIPCAAREAEVARALKIDPPELSDLRARIAEVSGKPDEARAILEQAIAAPGRTGGGRFEDADRALGGAIAAWPQGLSAYIRRAQIRMYDLGDIEGALQAAGGNRRAQNSTDFKRVRDMARYLRWSRSAGRSREDLRRVVQVAYLAPEEALVTCARYPALAKDFELMLGAGLVGNLDAVDGAGDTALIAASAGGNAPIVRLLVERHANVNAADWRQRRPVTFAVARADHETLALLLRAGADADFKDLDGRSPLLIAVQNGDSQSAAALLRARSGRSAGPPEDAGGLLEAAARLGDVATLRALLDAGANVDATGPRGETALVVAVRWGRAGAARLLLERGADATKAVEAAQDTGDAAMLELLKPYLKRGA